MSIESLKAQARRHEQKEEWQKALDEYGKAIAKLEAEEQPDPSLVNRVGDLYVKVGDYQRGLDHYERAVSLYRDAYLPNSAIAVCKKIVRNMPAHAQVYLVMGQIRAEQGFLPEARADFLRYAELMQELGNLDESFRALIELCDLVPAEIDLRLTVAEQLLANERVDEAFVQFGVVYRVLKDDEREDRALGLERRLLELDPDLDFDALLADARAHAAAASGEGAYGEAFIPAGGGFHDPDREPGGEGEMPGEEAGALTDADTLGDADALVDADAWVEADALVDADALVEPDWTDAESEELAAALDLPEPSAEAGVGPTGPEGHEEIGAEVEEGADADAQDLPFLEVDDEGADSISLEPAALGDDEGAVELPLLEVELAFEEVQAEWTVDEAGGDEAADLPILEAGDEDADLPILEGTLDEGADLPILEGTLDEDADLPILEGTEDEPAPAAPDAPGEQWVDLSSMIFGDEPAEPKTTRFRVQYQEPTGDEAADFQKMLSQFKAKVSENLEASDVRAHHDLGTAYKEMGLLDEAVGEFQAALRASADHLPTYELLGQTFLEMGQPEAATKSLERALRVPARVEDELLGIYYYLARAYEQSGNRQSAVEFYDRVFSLDINFADVTERLRALR